MAAVAPCDLHFQECLVSSVLSNANIASRNCFCRGWRGGGVSCENYVYSLREAAPVGDQGRQRVVQSIHGAMYAFLPCIFRDQHGSRAPNSFLAPPIVF